MTFKFISISDIHIGHNNINVHLVHEHLKKFLYPLLNDDLDVLFLVGDFTHTLLHLSNDAAFISLKIMKELGDLSNKHNFQLRVLKGTSEHDRDQNKYFLMDPDKYPNVQVIDKMTIELMDKIGAIAYCPDDLPYDNAQEVLINMISDYGLDQISMLVHHGFFKHEIPPNVPIQPYNLFNWDILKKYIKVCVIKGHVHTSSIYHKVFDNGSFERMKHGEEENKGFFVFEFDPDTFKLKHNFIVNEDTYIFKTLDLGPDVGYRDLHDHIKQLLSTIGPNVPDPIFIRCKCFKALKTNVNFKDLSFDREIRFSFLFKDEIEDVINDVIMDLSKIDLPTMTDNNMADFICRYIAESFNESISSDTIRKYYEED